MFVCVHFRGRRCHRTGPESDSTEIKKIIPLGTNGTNNYFNFSSDDEDEGEVNMDGDEDDDDDDDDPTTSKQKRNSIYDVYISDDEFHDHNNDDDDDEDEEDENDDEVELPPPTTDWDSIDSVLEKGMEVGTLARIRASKCCRIFLGFW